ncbi:Protein slit [Taenia crassiceps]|uniref:Protein slit n=1 Tax=Taenia crassiceps TaxID=6207 RepID=A0ABR4QL31_9CEST
MYYIQNLVIPLLLLTPTTFSLRCPPPPTSGLYACRNRSLHEVPLPIGAPIKNRLAITILDVSDNLIQLLHEDALRPYPALTCLQMERNLLWKITDHAFQAVPRLQRLLLRGNRLAVQAGSFSPKALLQLKQLRELDLSENPLGQLLANFFPSSLQGLRLESTIPSLIFQPTALGKLKNLQELSLANNSFNGLPTHLGGELRSLRNLKRLYLDGNTWNCDCHLIWLARIVRGLNTTALCHRPKALENQQIADLPLTEFQCAPVALNKNGAENRITEVEVGSTVTMVCHFYAEPRGRIRWLRSQVDDEEGEVESVATGVEKGVVERVLGDSLTKTNLTLHEVQAGVDDGIYRCEAENARGKDAVVFRIRVGYQRSWNQRYRGNGGFTLTSAAWTGVVVGGGVLLVSLTLLSVVIYCCQKERADCEPPRSVVIKQHQRFEDNAGSLYLPDFTLTPAGGEETGQMTGVVHYQITPTSDWFTDASNEIERL